MTNRNGSKPSAIKLRHHLPIRPKWSCPLRSQSRPLEYTSRLVAAIWKGFVISYLSFVICHFFGEVGDPASNRRKPATMELSWFKFRISFESRAMLAFGAREKRENKTNASHRCLESKSGSYFGTDPMQNPERISQDSKTKLNAAYRNSATSQTTLPPKQRYLPMTNDK